MNLVEVGILFLVFIFIVYEARKDHPNPGITTHINFLAIKFALCQTYQKNFPNSIAETINNKVFKEKVVDLKKMMEQNL
jgi:hypothetical protein